MNEGREPDWDPRSEDVLKDQLSAYDKMRKNYTVAFSELMHWTVFRYDDVLSIINDYEKFSNAVSQHLNVPAGMDPPEHTEYRQIINKYFTPERMNAFEPTCRAIVMNLISNAQKVNKLELMSDFALPFAVRVQCAFLNWPPVLHKKLTNWTNRNFTATLIQDRQAMSDIALEFEAIVDEMCEARIKMRAKPENDIMASLMHEKVWGRILSNEEIASILRTWTVGEIGSIASSIGILIYYLAEDDELQAKLRSDPTLLPQAIDEILRMHGPLVSSRRITKCPVEINGKKIKAGERISLNWISANRDGSIFEEADSFRLDRDPLKNLLYGAGIHACPGAPLARMEMRVVLQELLSSTKHIKFDIQKPPVLERYPASGFAILPILIEYN